EPPANPKLKPQSEWRLIGKSLSRVENPAKLDGSAVFGMDFRVPDMVYAAVRTSSVFGGSVRKFDKASIRNFPGVIDVVPIPNGVAVVAKSFWQAKQALDALDVTFDHGPNATLNSAGLKQQYRSALEGNSWVTPHATGDKDALAKGYATVFSEEYE